MDLRNWVIGLLVSVAAYFLAREFSRKDANEKMVIELSKAVVAIQGAVSALEKFNESQASNIAEVRKERHDCELRCPYRNGVK